MKKYLYKYPVSLSPKIERHIIKDRTTIPLFSLNALINELLNKHYKINDK